MVNKEDKNEIDNNIDLGPGHWDSKSSSFVVVGKCRGSRDLAAASTVVAMLREWGGGLRKWGEIDATVC